MKEGQLLEFINECSKTSLVVVNLPQSSVSGEWGMQTSLSLELSALGKH